MTPLLKITMLGCLLLGAISTGCTHEPDVSSAAKISFSQVQSIFNNKCASCHGVGGEQFVIDSAAIISHVVAFKPLKSKLFTAVTNTYGYLMPPLPNSPLDADQRIKIYLWILQGADPGQ